MNAWLWGAAVLLAFGLGPALWCACRGPAAERLAGMAFAGLLGAVVLLLLAQGFGRSSYVDLALVLAVLSPAGTLVFTRLLPTAVGARAPRTPPGRDGGDEEAST